MKISKRLAPVRLLRVEALKAHMGSQLPGRVSGAVPYNYSRIFLLNSR